MDVLMILIILAPLLAMTISKSSRSSIIWFWAAGCALSVYFFTLGMFYLFAFQFMAVSGFTSAFLLIDMGVEDED
jgi:hypothetical protein